MILFNLRSTCCFLVFLCGFFPASAQPRLTDVNGSNNAFQFHIGGPQPTILQASSDLRTWVNLQTNLVPEVNYSDSQSRNFSRRFYRLVTFTPPVINPSPLSDLSQLPNEVFIPNEGFNTLQFSPSGNLGLIVWKNRDLIYRERTQGGAWSEAVVTSDGGLYQARGFDEQRFQPLASLLFDSASRPHVFEVNGGSIRHLIRENGSWRQTEVITPSGAGSAFALFAVSLGANDSIHIGVIGDGYDPNLVYGSNKSGNWNWSTVTRLTGRARGFFQQSCTPRFFSMAIDSQNAAHFAFTREFALPRGPEGYLKPYSELSYASNRPGYWIIERVNYPVDGSGDCGQGASIAIGPDGEPAIAGWWNERASTGSAQFGHVRYHRRNSNGNWSNDYVMGYTDGYNAGDGDKGTGFSPYLRFDNQGRPHISFSDDASQHFSTGQNEYAGQIRHAYHNGSQWRFHTVYEQRDALQKQMVYPAMALSGNEMVFMGLERQTQWLDSRNAVSTYRLVYRSEPLP